jgi:hypothetical protein
MRLSLLLVGSLALAACGGGDRDAEGMPSEVLPEVEVEVAPRVEAPRVFDEEGNLLPSDEHVAGLTLPRGLTANGSDDERTHTYLARNVPIAAILRYFGPRLTTGQVEAQAGGGASYRHAIPREVHAGAVPLDVTILPVPMGQVLVEVREIPPAPTAPPPEAESLRALTAAMGSAE